MPIQSTDSTTTVTVASDNESWIIAEHVNVATSNTGILDAHDHNNVANFGHVVSSLGVEITGDFNYFDNGASGTIQGSTFGVKTSGTFTHLDNEGMISGGTAVYTLGSVFSLNNSGTINGRSEGVLDNGPDAGTYINSGVISANDIGLYLQTGAYSSATINNTGTISGGSYSIADEYTGLCAAQIHNSGLLDGTVDLSFGATDSSVLNTGRINGDLLLGHTNDTYDGRSGAITGLVNGGEGNDLIRAGVGEDTIIGGAGRDRMDGGKGGDDTFVFTDVKDSRPASADIITKHWDASDTIDLSAVEANTALAGQQHFTFGGAVTPGASLTTGVVGYYVQAGNTYVVADVNGDHKADLQLVIHGAYTLTADEFAL